MRALPVAAAGVVGWTVPALAPLIPSLCDGLRIDRRLDDGSDSVALTFDDGPHPDGTPAVLEILDRAGARATFFMVGEQVERFPALAREVADAGHAIALHGHRHRNQLRLAPHAVAADLERGGDVVSGATGARLDLYRPPFGIFSAAGLAVVRRSGLTPTLWSRWGRDWRRSATGASIAAKATEGLRAGDVVLLHDADYYSAPGSWRRTAQALPRILETVAARGLRPVVM